MPRPLSHYKPEGVTQMGNTGIWLVRSEPWALTICNAGEYPLEAHPELLRLSMRIISAWSILDSYVARSFAAMLGDKADPAIAMYTSLGSTRAQHDAIKAAARVSLPKLYQELLSALLRLYKDRSRMRHRVAHHLWGHSDAAPDGVILLDPRVYIHMNEEGNVDYSQISVYEESDFTQSIEEIEELSGLFHQFYFMVWPHAHRAEPIFRRLLLEHPVQSVVTRLFRGSEIHQELQRLLSDESDEDDPQ